MKVLNPEITVAPPSGIALAGAVPEDSTADKVSRFVAVAAQAFLILWLVRRFRIENDLFQIVMVAGLLGFCVHYFLPQRLKLTFFAILSSGVIWYSLGLDQGKWNWIRALQLGGFLYGAGAVLIATCNLPVSFAIRSGLLIALGGGLAYLRTGVIPVLDPIWAIFGAMFMFRTIVYLYDTDGEKQKPTLVQTISYFFLFPNLWLYVAPVLDFKAFRKCYYNADSHVIYQKGILWMVRGIVHLLLWRLVYYQVYIDPARVTNGTELAQFLLGNVALYLRLSGQFHIMTGLLHLFGFNLAATHHNYFLASSFVDYWRRVNIYWKDFIVKVFYYPLVIRFKKLGMVPSIMLATILAFVGTWILHPYQFFWIRGSMHLPIKDAVFWGALGACVCVNSILELKGGRRRTLTKKAVPWSEALATAGKAGATFLALMLLWAIWTCDSIAQWVDIWRNFTPITAVYCGAAVLVIMVASLLMEEPFKLSSSAEANPVIGAGWFGPWKTAAVHCLIPGLVIAGATSSRATALVLPREGQEIVESIYKNTPNKSDEEFMVRGYYEDLADTSRFQTLLNDAFRKQPKDWIRLEDTHALRQVADFRTQELVPSVETTVNGKLVRTNRAGMRDNEVELVKPPGTVRIAVLGASHEMGFGVNNGEVASDLLEAQLNSSLHGKSDNRVEVLNFACNHYSPVAQVEVMKRKVLGFHPDMVLMFSHREDVGVTMRLFAQALRQGADPSGFPFLAGIAAKADVSAKTPRSIAERRLIPYWPEMIAWAFREVSSECRRNGVQPVWVLQESIYPESSVDAERLIGYAKDAGFTVITMKGVFDGHDPEKLVVAPWDAHPNADGHRLIAETLYRKLSTLPEYLELTGRSQQ
jgi:hypothetical protein